MSAGADRVLLETELRPGDLLRVTLSEFRGQQYLSVRHYWKPGAEDWAPTKRGVTLSLELAAEVVGAMRQALEADEAAA